MESLCNWFVSTSNRSLTKTRSSSRNHANTNTSIWPRGSKIVQCTMNGSALSVVIKFQEKIECVLRTTAQAWSPTAKCHPNLKMSPKITISSESTPTNLSTKESNGSNKSSQVCGKIRKAMIKHHHSIKSKTAWLEIRLKCVYSGTWERTLNEKTWFSLVCLCFPWPSLSCSPYPLISSLPSSFNTKFKPKVSRFKIPAWSNSVREKPSWILIPS